MEINVLLPKCLGLSAKGEGDTCVMLNTQVYKGGKTDLDRWRNRRGFIKAKS